MRVIKQRLRELIPAVQCFLGKCTHRSLPRDRHTNPQSIFAPLPSVGHLPQFCLPHILYPHSWAHAYTSDVDDLEDVSQLEACIERSGTLLVFLSQGYTRSRNCMRELVAGTKASKPLIALLEPDTDRGGLRMDEVEKLLIEAEASYTNWGFDTDAPRGDAVFDALMRSPPIDWDRLGEFQEVSLRLIAERLLSVQIVELTGRPLRRMSSTALRNICGRSSKRFSSGYIRRDAAVRTYVQGELTRTECRLMGPRFGRRYHLYCSPLVAGTAELIEELREAFRLDLQVSQDPDELQQCERMLGKPRQNHVSPPSAARLTHSACGQCTCMGAHGPVQRAQPLAERWREQCAAVCRYFLPMRCKV